MNANRYLLILLGATFSAGCVVVDDGRGYPRDRCGDCGHPPAPSRERISMYATGATASSDGIPGYLDYSAAQALGAPDVFSCSDDPRAWSPELAERMPGVAPDGDTIDEFLEVTFPVAVHVSQVQIFESFNPGAVVAVDLESSTGSAPVMVLWEDFSGDGPAPCPSAFIIDVAGTTDHRYDRVVVYLDTNLVGDANGNGTPSDDYNSIDAVMLTGDVPR